MMRKILLHTWIWSGLVAFYFLVKLIVGAMSTQVALGFCIGIIWALGCVYGYEKIDRWERSRYGDES
jgi:hypothetical protein